jgi:pyruvate/2-oxoglutarate dehydrogenase complex dihydrolipoamide acyltransferase (E2) component
VITRVAKEGDDIKIGGLVAYIDTDAAAPEKSAVVSPQSQSIVHRKKKKSKSKKSRETEIDKKETIDNGLSTADQKLMQQAHHRQQLKKY